MDEQTGTGAAEDGDGAAEGAAQVDADVSNIFEKIDAWLDGFLALLPNLVVAAVFLAVMIGAAILVQKLIFSTAKNAGRENLGEVGGQLVKWSLIVVGFLFAVTIVAPSIAPADLLAALGVGSVAIGFAFKDILQNLLAGILILLRQPFKVGDQIRSGSHEGTVERIETRATILKTYDGRRVVVPNSEIYTDAVVVMTAHAFIRSQYDVGIGYADDIATARQSMIEAMNAVEGVCGDPAPEVLAWELAGSSVNLRARWWTDSRRASVVHVRDRVIEAIKDRLDEEAIDMPYPTQVLLMHDQTEATDGDRTAQREGWPAGDSPPDPRPIASDSEGDEEREAESSAAK